MDVNEGVLPCPVEVPNMFSNNQTDAVTDIERCVLPSTLHESHNWGTLTD